MMVLVAVVFCGRERDTRMRSGLDDAPPLLARPRDEADLGRCDAEAASEGVGKDLARHVHRRARLDAQDALARQLNVQDPHLAAAATADADAASPPVDRRANVDRDQSAVACRKTIVILAGLKSSDHFA